MEPPRCRIDKVDDVGRRSGEEGRARIRRVRGAASANGHARYEHALVRKTGPSCRVIE